jgi:subtilisin family serine protease
MLRKANSCVVVALILLFSIVVVTPRAQAKIPIDVAQATSPVKFKLNLVSSTNRISANVAYDYGFKGQDTHVVVIDSGVETTHPFLNDKVVLEACFANVCPNGTTRMIGQGAAKPVHWHGTHVAGIVAGSDSSMRGVAPEAKIIAVNVFATDGSTWDGHIQKALEWVSSISSSYNISSVNMSLGTSTVFKGTCDNYLPDITRAILDLKSKNIATVISAGNSYAHGMSSPACISSSVSVSASYSNLDKITSFSNVSDFTTFAAPGHSINSSSTSGLYRHASGTSMAAPHVSGAFAVYRSKFGIRPVDDVVADFQRYSPIARDDYTGIQVKRIDFTYLMTGSSTSTTTTTSTTSTTSTTTTIPDSTTTTTTTTTTVYIPPISTTTTTTVPPADGGVEFGFNVPYIMFLKKYTYNNSYLYLDFVYKYNSKKVGNFIFECLYSDQSVFARTVPSKNYSYNRYFVKLSTDNIDSCRMAAVGIDGQKGQYSDYVKVK